MTSTNKRGGGSKTSIKGRIEKKQMEEVECEMIKEQLKFCVFE